MSNNSIINQEQYRKLQQDIAKILTRAKEDVKNAANKILADSYWQIGEKIHNVNLTQNANYQNLTLRNLEQDLKINKNALGKALNLYQTYPKGIKESLSWSHYCQLVSVKDSATRNNLAKKSESQNWSVRQLESNIKQLNSGQEVLSGKNSKKIKRPSDPSYLYLATIVDVVDGDTLILNIDLGFDVIKKQRIRLTQINAPEIKTTAGKKSHHYLRDLCAGIEKVAVKTNKVDIYGRFLADIFFMEGPLKRGTNQGDIFTKGIYLNEKLVEEGVAAVF